MARHFLPAFFAVALVTAPAVAARRRPVVVQEPDALTITFVAAGDALDAGRIAHDFSRRSAKGVTTVTRTFAVRVDRRDATHQRLVSLRASVEIEDPRCTLRIDGVEIHGAPNTIAIVTTGAATTHRLEIEVPISAEEGALLTSIRWEASEEDNR
ncbi:MAG TPA: hypothetical protein VGQ46_21325 [Thermoanaerobaculia bacterium]|jgi:hypothetical protein|nr:hypothetical protein [Thermoanaerobaculia bacterium]